jgi:hypothetical protein
MMFACGSFTLFAVTIGRYLDPPRPNEWIRSVSDSWIWSIGDGLMLAGAFLAELGMFLGYLASI